MIAALLAESPIVLAPMEDVTDAAFRRICRSVGATTCVTEFIGAEQVIADSELARRRAMLAEDDRPTAIQIYGENADQLLAAARIAARARPAFLDLNCGCWIPRIARRGAGAGWLREPTAMVEMAARIVKAVDVPVTVKTRIGIGGDVPIVDIARRLEDVGVAAIAIHCRTAEMGHRGAADWSWARRAQEVVRIPVIVNGGISDARDVVRALRETGCAGVMIGRAAIAYPWVFREARALLAGEAIAPPSDEERRAIYMGLLDASVQSRGERHGVASAKRHVGVVAPALQHHVRRACTLGEALAALS